MSRGRGDRSRALPTQTRLVAKCFCAHWSSTQRNTFFFGGAVESAQREKTAVLMDGCCVWRKHDQSGCCCIGLCLLLLTDVIGGGGLAGLADSAAQLVFRAILGTLNPSHVTEYLTEFSLSLIPPPFCGM